MIIEQPHGMLLDAQGRVVQCFSNWYIGEHQVPSTVASVTYVDEPANLKEPHWEYKAINSDGKINQHLTISEAKSVKKSRIKNRARIVLSETDWYVTRKQETGDPIPESVTNHRTEVRSLSDQFERDVDELESVTEVRGYSFEYPEPPKP